MSDEQHAELLAVFKATTDDLERAKQWGWSITYQTVLVQFALVGLRRQLLPPGLLVDALLLGVVLGVTGLALVLLGGTQRSIDKFRCRLRRCRDRFTPEAREVLGEPDERKRVWPFGVVVCVTALVALAVAQLSGGRP